MWKINAIMTLMNLLLTTVRTDFTITPSLEVGSYHYPAPPKSLQLQVPASRSLQFNNNNNAPQSYHHQYRGNYYLPAFVAKQFNSPALDNAAFNLALTNQDYTLGNAALRLRSRTSKTIFRIAPPPAPSSSSPPSTSPSAAAIGSVNVKLPLPIGTTPINIAPLPLQTGAPYAAIPNSVTSYGTIYPQRRKR